MSKLSLAFFLRKNRNHLLNRATPIRDVRVRRMVSSKPTLSPDAASMLIDDLTTPAVLIDHDRLDRNITRMQATASDHGVQLRPHIKTHKSVDIAQRQVDQGAQGLTVATLNEAEAFARAGFDDIRIAYPVVGRQKHERVIDMMDDTALSFCVDTVDGVEQASGIYASHDAVARVLIEVDVGHGRCGIPYTKPKEAVALARHIASAPGLSLVGVLTHGGQGYHGPRDGETKEAALRRTGIEERDRILEIATALFDADVPRLDRNDFAISIGSTPTMTYFENTARDGLSITEVRPGNYVF